MFHCLMRPLFKTSPLTICCTRHDPFISVILDVTQKQGPCVYFNGGVAPPLAVLEIVLSCTRRLAKVQVKLPRGCSILFHWREGAEFEQEAVLTIT